MDDAEKAYKSSGIVRVETGTVTVSDIRRADEAATSRRIDAPRDFARKTCLYYELDGHKLKSPLGEHGQALEAVWELVLTEG